MLVGPPAGELYVPISDRSVRLDFVGTLNCSTSASRHSARLNARPSSGIINIGGADSPGTSFGLGPSRKQLIGRAIDR